MRGRTKCGVCGAGFVVYYRDRLGCFGTRERGTCTNTLTIPRQEVEERVLRALQEKLMRTDFFEEFCDEFTKEVIAIWAACSPWTIVAKKSDGVVNPSMRVDERGDQLAHVERLVLVGGDFGEARGGLRRRRGGRI